jgi:hypothetical protein
MQKDILEKKDLKKIKTVKNRVFPHPPDMVIVCLAFPSCFERTLYRL